MDKHQLATKVLRTKYTIQSTGATQVTSLVASDVALNLEGHMVNVLPLVLEDQGIDIILGMNWMNQNKVLMDLESRTISFQNALEQLVKILYQPIKHWITW